MILSKITKTTEYKHISAKGARVVAKSFVLLYCRHDTDGSEGMVRYGLTASRKLGNAVRRNRIKRRLRAVCQQVLPQAGRAGWDYVLIGRTAAHDVPFEKIVHDLMGALAQTEAR